MSESKTRLDYAIGTPIRQIRWLRQISIVTAVAVAAGAFWINKTQLGSRIRCRYWQWKCATYADVRPIWVNDPGIHSSSDIQRNYVKSDVGYPSQSAATAVALWPVCWQNLIDELAIHGHPLPSSFFDEHCWPIVFLHERVSHGGTRRIICMEIRPNIDHAQMCSLDCAVITPATLSAAPQVTARVVQWIPGWWSWGIRKDKLKLAQADSMDPSHFVLQYDHNPPPKGDPDLAIFNDEPQTYTVDCWLNDNGAVTATVREHE